MGRGVFFSYGGNTNTFIYMSKLIIKTGCKFDVELERELLNFSDDQLQAIKDINAILEHSGVVLYGALGLKQPRF